MVLKSIQKIESSKDPKIPKEQPKQCAPNKSNIKKIVLAVIGGILAALILVWIGWYFGHQATVNGN